MKKPIVARFYDADMWGNGSVCVCGYYVTGRGEMRMLAELEHRVEHLEGKHGYEENETVEERNSSLEKIEKGHLVGDE
jgi:hypothetical protein